MAACESEGVSLRNEQANTREVHEDALLQMKQWRDFAKIMDVKQRVAAMKNPQFANAVREPSSHSDRM